MLLVFDLQLQTWDEPAKTLPAQRKQRKEGVSVRRELSAVVWGGGALLFQVWGAVFPGRRAVIFQLDQSLSVTGST